jgi:hypothetical protein
MVRSLPLRSSHDLASASTAEDAGRSHFFLVRLFWTLYLVLSALQIFAVAGGLHRTVNAPLWLAALVALVIGPWPIIGTGLGIAGAHYGWGLAWSAATVLFLSLVIPVAAIVVWARHSTSGSLALHKQFAGLRRTP